MSTLDIILSCCYALSIFAGFRKGLVMQVTAVLALVVALWAAYLFAGQMSTWLSESTGHVVAGSTGIILSYVIVFLLAVWICHLIGHVLSKSIRLIALGWLDRIGGVILGIVTCTLILGVLINIFNMVNSIFPMVTQETLEGSVLYGKICDAMHQIFPRLREMFETVTETANNVPDTVA